MKEKDDITLLQEYIEVQSTKNGYPSFDELSPEDLQQVMDSLGFALFKAGYHIRQAYEVIKNELGLNKSTNDL